MIRKVRQTNAPHDKLEEARPRAFSDFESAPNLVLLGDPGAGKSHVFRESAKAEGATLITARAFLATPANKLHGKVLFIDGLDEKRSGRGDRDTVDALVEKLFAVNPAKVRISCRVADWLGDSDLAALHPYFEQMGTPPVLLLQKLLPNEQLKVLTEQGAPSHDAVAFLNKAKSRGLDDFLENPQNLLMLWRAVQTGSWPETRKEVFEQSTGLMLQEFDPEHARKGSGIYVPAELRHVAGAVCAARLIADVEAISLTEQEGIPEIPGYRSLTFLDPAKVQAALSRRIFVAGPEPETVDYAHRTTAEYLAAAFLAQQVRGGLPFGRVMALIGVAGHPASELRGLHAWLAVHLPEYADELIETDPYGVLTYGDAASLEPSSCVALLRALGRLSKSDPWFRSGNWDVASIGALSRSDIIEEFHAILSDPNAGFGLRSVVIDALRLGTLLPELQPDLVSLLSQGGPYAERLHALTVVLRNGEEGKSAIVAAFSKLGKSANDLRLRAEIIQQLYGQPFGPAEVVQLVNDTWRGQDDFLASGTLWAIADHIPLADLPSVLDGIVSPQQNEYGQNNRRHGEVEMFFTHSLVRVWSDSGPFDAERASRWLYKRLAFGDDRQVQELHTAISDAPKKLEALAGHFFGTLVADNERWQKYALFQRSTLQTLSAGTAFGIVADQLNSADEGSARRSFFYELAFSLCYRLEQPHAGKIFEALYELAALETGLEPVRSDAVKSNLYEGYFKGRKNRQTENDAARERQRTEFAQKVERIRSGADLGWLNHLGKIYFALYSDVDNGLEPRDRVAAWVGDDHIESAIAGLRAALLRHDVPAFADVMASMARHRHYDWWHALIAGLNEHWATGQGFAGLTDDFLKAMLAFDVTNPISIKRNRAISWLKHPWRDALLQQRPELARDVYLAVARLRLAADEQGIDGLHELLTEPAFEPYRKAVVIELLGDFPHANLFRLNDMLDAATKLPDARQEFLVLAENVVSGTAANNEPQYERWLATAYLVSPAQFSERLEDFTKKHPDIIFQLRDRSGFATRGQPNETALSLPQLELLARLTGTFFPDAPYPAGGWSGDTNAWDAAEYCRRLFDAISALPTAAATHALERLAANTDLTSYKPHILHALANQRKRRRDVEYDRPDWPRTVTALANGPPATAADLHALVVAQLLVLKKRIERENTDIYKQFWNIDGSARPTTPRPEEACRDDLLTLMRPHLQALGIAAEPEGHMARDKRADIAVSIAGHKIFCELKRDSNAELWTAPIAQLDRFYTPDPGAKGFGIYCVFWFGDKRTGKIPAPPKGVTRPASAEALEKTITELLPENAKSRITVIVIDVSGRV